MKIKVISKRSAPGGRTFEYAPGFSFVYDADCTDYDWLVVCDELPEADVGTMRGGCERLFCPRERTILATYEPVSIKCYSRAYALQFGRLLTNRPPSAERHPGYRLGRGYYPWFNDRTYEENKSVVIPPKTKTVSAVCSSKAMKWTRHYDRLRLMRVLSAEIEGMEWFGHGIRSFGKKYEVMDPYKYHVAIENHIAPHCWTEKIADAFLCECLPFYAGAPDLGEDFPPESFIPIPIDDPAEAVRIVKGAIAAGEYERRREAVLEAKRLILSKYNFWAQVVETIGESAGMPVGAPGGRIYSRKRIRRRNIGAAVEAGCFHLRQYLAFAGGRGLISP